MDTHTLYVLLHMVCAVMMGCTMLAETIEKRTGGKKGDTPATPLLRMLSALGTWGGLVMILWSLVALKWYVVLPLFLLMSVVVGRVFERKKAFFEQKRRAVLHTLYLLALLCMLVLGSQFVTHHHFMAG